MRYKELIGKTNKFGADEGLRYIIERRPFASPNSGFMEQLLQYEIYLESGRTSDEYECVRELSDAERRVQDAALKSIEEMVNLLRQKL